MRIMEAGKYTKNHKIVQRFQTDFKELKRTRRFVYFEMLHLSRSQYLSFDKMLCTIMGILTKKYFNFIGVLEMIHLSNRNKLLENQNCYVFYKLIIWKRPHNYGFSRSQIRAGLGFRLRHAAENVNKQITKKSSFDEIFF